MPAGDPQDRRGLPAPGAIGAGSAPDRPTRKPLSLWDRSKFLLLLFLLFWFFVWSEYSNPNPFNTVGDAIRDTFRTKWPLFVLAGIELLRQIHYLISEHSAAYHRFWTESVFGRVERRTGKMNDWNRYRIARAAKVLILVAVASIILGTLYDVAPATALVQLPARLWSWLPLLAQGLALIVFVVLQFVAIFWFLSRGGVDTYMPEEIKTRFSDVWGQDHVLDRVRENMVFLERPHVIEEKGGYVPSGILLYGPPGTGKTLMAEAVAGETGRPYVFVDPGAFINMFMGVGILKVKSLFRKLRKLALRYGGVIVFFDEADALGSRGTLMPGGEFGAAHPSSPWHNDHVRWTSPATQSLLLASALARSSAAERPPATEHKVIMGGMGMGGGGGGTLQALLSELSGLKKPRGIINRYGRRLLGMQPKPPPKYRILVMMATNMPESLDPAMLRPGRIDRIYKVGYPSKEGRVRTYQGYLDKVSNDLTSEQVEKLAVITPYATGAEMKDLVNEALIVAIRDGHDIITWTDVMKAKHLKDLGPPEDVEYIERERHAIAVHEACHAVAAYRTNTNTDIDLATIEKGGNYLGMVRTIKPEDQFSQWRSELEASIIVSLASLAGERLFFDGNNTSGVSGDLETATTIAMAMEAYFGMGQTVTSHSVTRNAGVGGSGRRGGSDENSESEIIRGALGERIEDNLARLLQEAGELLKANRAEVLRLAHALGIHKTISGEDVKAIIDGRVGPLVNGAAYVNAEFVNAMESFHAAVVAAHKAHEQVALPLPSVATTPPAAPTPVDPGHELAAAREGSAATGVLVADPPPPPPPPPAAGSGYYGNGGYRGNGGASGGDGAGNGDDSTTGDSTTGDSTTGDG